MPFVNVIELYSDLTALFIRERKEKQGRGSDEVIRRRAGDDWF